MSIRVGTTYLAICDYPGCYLGYEFWELTEEHAIETVIDDEEWLCLFTGDNEPRFFCPLHLRYRPDSSPDGSPTVLFDSDRPTTQPTLRALNKYYEDMSTPQPLPKLECEYTILAVLTSEDAK
jgi:hypothetical protein